jgi:hypothetical protein
MNNPRMRKLFDAARAERPVEPPPPFAVGVVRAIQRDRRASEPASIFDSLAALFPGLAWSAALVIVLSAALAFYLFRPSANDLSVNVARVADPWLFTVN